MTRGEAEFENDVIRPKVALLRLTPGLPGMNQLSALNASTGASNLWLLGSANCRTSDKSSTLKPGPSYALRTELPYVPNAGCAKAVGLNQLLIVPSPYGLSLTWSARWVVAWIPDNARSMPD